MISTLIDFLFRSVLGLWLTFLVVTALCAPFLAAFRTWRRSRRYRRAQAAKLLNPDNAEVRCELAQIYLEGRGLRRAERYAREAVEIAGRNPLYDGVPQRFLRVLGQALYGRRRWEEARVTFEQALRAKSDTGAFDALLGLSKSLLRLGRGEEALDAAKRAVSENTSALEAYFRWAQSAALAGRADEVRSARQEFWRVRAGLPAFARQRRLWFALAFLVFPISRRVG